MKHKEERSALSTVRLTTRGWIQGLIVDLDERTFYIADIRDHAGVRGLLADEVDGVVPVPRALVARVVTQ